MYSETAVHTAIDSGNYNEAKLLLALEDFPITYKRRFDGYPTVLHRAVESQNTEIVKAVLENLRIDINFPASTDTGGEYECALSFAIKISMPVQEIFEAILAHPGVDVNIRDNFNRTPLAATALKGRLKMMKLLRAKDEVDKDPVDDDDNTLMHLAVLSGKQSMVDFILAINGTDLVSRTSI
jgi:ankyrin repeat protein